MTALPPTKTQRRSEPPPPPALPAGSHSNIAIQIERLEGQLTRLKAQVRQAQQLASLGTAAATIAHEMNNLLTPMRSFAQTALECGDPALQKKALTVAVTNAQMLAAMADRVLTMGAAKSPTREAVSVRAAAEDAAACLCRDLAKDGIRFSIKADDAVSVWADPLHVRQVLFNLFLNARNAMAESRQGHLIVSAQRHGDRVVLTVEDGGPGIAPEKLPHVFDPLWTSKSTDGAQRCAGLGLALCHDLVEENGGTIGVRSEEGVGTTFTITLPAGDVSTPSRGL